MFCPNCGKELPEESRFCLNCGKETARESIPRSKPALSIPLNSKTMLALAGVVIVALLAILIFRLGGEQAADPAADGSAVTEQMNPANALVGRWSGRDGVGLHFTKDGTVTLSGFGLDLGGDTFTYEVMGPNTLSLTAQVGGLVSAGFEVPYVLSGNTLQVELAGYLLELTRD